MAICEYDDSSDVTLDKIVFYAIFADGHPLYHDEDTLTVFRTKNEAVEYIKTNVTPISQVVYTVARYSVCNDDAREVSNYQWKTMACLVPQEMEVTEDTTSETSLSWDL